MGSRRAPFGMSLWGEPVVVICAYLFRRRGGVSVRWFPLFLTDYGQTVGRIGILGILG